MARCVLSRRMAHKATHSIRNCTLTISSPTRFTPRHHITLMATATPPMPQIRCLGVNLVGELIVKEQLRIECVALCAIRRESTHLAMNEYSSPSIPAWIDSRKIDQAAIVG